MSESKDSYFQIIKATSIFGSVQFLNIIFSIIRTKFISIFIGPAGMGIVVLLQSTMNIISSFTGLGLETSTVKQISGNYKNEDLKSIASDVTIIKKLAWITGIFGVLISLLFSGWLSQITFGNSEHTIAFILLSVTVLFRQLTLVELAILQGLRKLRLLAKVNLYGNFFGLLFSIPLYYYYRIDAIVPTIIVTSLVSLVFSYYFLNSINIVNNKVPKEIVISDSKNIFKLGVMLTFSGLLTLITTYLIQIYIGKIGGLTDVGFYNAGFTLLNSYVGIVFTVMSTEYFPRLTSICDDNNKVRISVTQQSFVSILIITPIIILFLTFITLIINVLYTSKFISIIPMISFGVLGMLFKAVSWAMGYIIIAKGDSKTFLKTSLGFNFLSLILNGIGYTYYGLEGLGVSFLIYYFIHFFVLKLISKKSYNFYFERSFYETYFKCILLCILAFLMGYIENMIIKYSLMTLLIFISIVFVFIKMNNKIGLKELYYSILKRK